MLHVVFEDCFRQENGAVVVDTMIEDESLLRGRSKQALF